MANSSWGQGSDLRHNTASEYQLRDILTRIEYLEEQLDKFDATSRQLNLKFIGLPEEKGHSALDCVIYVLNTYSCYDDWRFSDFHSAYRVGRQGRGARPVIVSFVRQVDKLDVLKDSELRTRLNDRGIKIAADLTARQRQILQNHKQQGRVAYYKGGKLFVQDRDTEQYDGAESRRGPPPRRYDNQRQAAYTEQPQRGSDGGGGPAQRSQQGTGAPPLHQQRRAFGGPLQGPTTQGGVALPPFLPFPPFPPLPLYPPLPPFPIPPWSLPQSSGRPSVLACSEGGYWGPPQGAVSDVDFRRHQGGESEDQSQRSIPVVPGPYTYSEAVSSSLHTASRAPHGGTKTTQQKQQLRQQPQRSRNDDEQRHKSLLVVEENRNRGTFSPASPTTSDRREQSPAHVNNAADDDNEASQADESEWATDDDDDDEQTQEHGEVLHQAEVPANSTQLDDVISPVLAASSASISHSPDQGNVVSHNTSLESSKTNKSNTSLITSNNTSPCSDTTTSALNTSVSRLDITLVNNKVQSHVTQQGKPGQREQAAAQDSSSRTLRPRTGGRQTSIKDCLTPRGPPGAAPAPAGVDAARRPAADKAAE